MGHGGECLNCCLCGKPANYRDLGDLCGPYYTEDGIPRKILTSKPSKGSSNRQHHWRYRRAERTERVAREGGPRRLTLRERFQRIKQLQATRPGTSDQEDNDSMFQRLQMEAEAKEHWAHENCTIWTKGIIMVAGRLYGLKEAAKSSCQIVGASLSCCWRGCSHKYHYVCAKEIGKRPQQERKEATTDEKRSKSHGEGGEMWREIGNRKLNVG
uniref:PHD-type domain-containing protein n=1 Tax=Sphaeramia orbicularis TaxID=375764 RepID=A0A672Z4E8_9TELE